MFSEAYMSTTEELKRRIVALIPGHPEILTLESPWDLFKIDGFDCRDLEPSMAQASWALSAAQAEYRDTSVPNQRRER